MKILKLFFLFLLAVLLIGVIYVATFSGAYDVSRSKIVKAPIEHSFNTVNNLESWEKWGPWHDEDSTIVVSYGDKKAGVGASSSWTSKDGPGRMNTVATVPNQSIDQEIFMGGDDSDPAGIYWKFDKVDEGTKITWGMKAEEAPFLFKFFAAISGGWEKMFGPMQEKGLDNLDKVIVSSIPAPTYRISAIANIESEGNTFIGFPHKIKINHEEMTKLFTQDMPKAGIYAVKNGLKEGDYVPGAVYTKYDEESNETEFYIGLLLHKNIKPAEGMKSLKLPKGKTLMISKFGNYGVGDEEAHKALDAYIKTNNLEQGFPIWELFVNDPSTVKPADIQTDIFYPVK